MVYQVTIPKAVQKQLDNLSNQIYERIIEDIIQLRNNPRPLNAIKMKNNQGYRIRRSHFLYSADQFIIVK